MARAKPAAAPSTQSQRLYEPPSSRGPCKNENLAGRRAILFREPLDHSFEIGITCAKTSRKPVSASLDNLFAVRQHIKLADLAGRTNRIDIQSLLD